MPEDVIYVHTQRDRGELSFRLPLDKSAAADEVRDDYFTNFIAEQVDAAAMATSADYDKLDPQTIYEAIVAAQAEG